jgi:hypothetical protein
MGPQTTRRPTTKAKDVPSLVFMRPSFGQNHY